jgi:plasmid maintenance system antidote protein VapI
MRFNMKRRLDQNHIPPVAMHPGELLRNEIKERGLKQTDLADKSFHNHFKINQSQS